MSSSFCGSIVALGLGIATAVLLVFVVNHSASDLLVDLKTSAAQTQVELDRLMAQLPSLLACDNQTNATVMDLMNCSDIALNGLSLNAALLANKTATLNMNSVASFNNTVNSIIQQQCDRIGLLEMQIAQAVNNQTTAIPLVLQNGTVIVRLQGGDMFNTTYELKQLVLGDLRVVTLGLPNWPNSLTSNATENNPVIFFEDFAPPMLVQPAMPAADVVKPLLSTQTARFFWTNTAIKVTHYRWNVVNQTLEFHSSGTSNPLDLVALLSPLSVLFQLL